MGSFKEKNREGVREIQENSKETTELGTEMTRQAKEINGVLESIELQDEEDTRAISETGRSYQADFDKAYGEQVESAGQEIEQQGKQIESTVEGELGNVRSGIGKLERVGGISEIGRQSAEAGQAHLERSADEYKGLITDAEGIVDQTKQQIESLKKNLSATFRG